MSETTTRTGAGATAQRVGRRLRETVSMTPILGRFSIGSESRSRFERVITQGRANEVDPALYKGRRDAGFDEPGLFCFLVERVEATAGSEVADVCDVYTDAVGELPVGVEDRARETFEELSISRAPAGSDLRRLAAVDVVVNEVAGYCVALEGSTDGEAAVAAAGGEA